jgi:hypothetical protein
MGRRKLHERLDRLERRIPQPPDQEKRERWTEHFLEHVKTWAEGRTLEEVPEDIRDAEVWTHARTYGLVFLELVEEGSIEGHEDLLAKGVDFNLSE